MTDTQFRGPVLGALGTTVPFTANYTGAQRVGDAHARYMQANLEGRLYSGGMGALTSISNSTFTVGTLTASCTPILGIYNPTTSGRYAAIMRASLQVIMTALQATGCGGFSWASSVGNIAVSTGAAPFSRLTGLAAGSVMKDVSGVALTGLTNSLVVRQGAQLGGGSSYNASLLGTAVGFQTQQVPQVETFDGAMIVPPGGVLALLCNTTPVAHSAVSGFEWEEIAIAALSTP